MAYTMNDLILETCFISLFVFHTHANRMSVSTLLTRTIICQLELKLHCLCLPYAILFIFPILTLFNTNICDELRPENNFRSRVKGLVHF